MNFGRLPARPARGSPERGSGGRLRHVLTLVALVGLGLFVHRDNLSCGLVGGDSYVQIFTSRIGNWAEFFDTFREPLGDRLILADFYRPVHNLCLAAEYALWGLEPVGYQLTTLACFAGCVALLYLLLRKLLGGEAWLVPAGATLLFALHPALLNVLPPPCRRPDLLAIGFLLAALLVLPTAGQRRRWLRRGLAAFFALLAAGSKEIGVCGAWLVFVHQLLWGCEPDTNQSRGVARTVRRAGAAVVAALPAVAAAGVYLLNRAAVVGPLGGYWAERAGSFGAQLAASGAQLAMDLLCPWSPWRSLTPIQLAAAPLALLALTVPAALITRLRGRGGTVGAGDSAEPDVSAGCVILLGLAWLLGPVLVLGLNPRYGPWYAVVPLVGLVLVLAGLAGTAGGLLRASPPRRAKWRVAVSLGSALTVLLTAVLSLVASPLWTEYPHWRQASRILTETQREIERKLATARPGRDVRVRLVPYYGPPMSANRPREPSPPHATLYAVRIWKAEGLQTWLALRNPRRPVQVVYADDPRPPRRRPRAIRLLLEIDRTTAQAAQ